VDKPTGNGLLAFAEGLEALLVVFHTQRPGFTCGAMGNRFRARPEALLLEVGALVLFVSRRSSESP